MDISKKTDRTALKSYFAKNAVPTASNFADLFDGMINQKEDGIAKPAGEPLSVQADGGPGSQKRALNLYKSFADDRAAWTLSLNPWADPKNSGTAKGGFSVGDADGNSKLFIDETTGNVGIGTVTPGGKLEVTGDVVIGGKLDVKGDAGVGGTLRAKSLRVSQFTASNTTAFTVSSANVWADFPGLGVKVNLALEANLIVFYQITANSSNTMHLVTRLMLDDAEVPECRSIAGNTVYWSPSSVWMGPLKAGAHTLRVQYRTPGAAPFTPSSDWEKAALMVTVFGDKTSISAF